MAEYERLTPPHEGQRVRIGEDGRLEVPDEPIIPKEQQRELRKIEERFASRLS